MAVCTNTSGTRITRATVTQTMFLGHGVEPPEVYATSSTMHTQIENLEASRQKVQGAAQPHVSAPHSFHSPTILSWRPHSSQT